MSWGIDIVGTKAGAMKRVAEQLDKVAANYEGKEEGRDVLACKERALALIAACDLSTDGYTEWNAVQVKANGSHSSNPKGLTSGNFQLTVTRMALALDPAT